jgi:hypothetical protein
MEIDTATLQKTFEGNLCSELEALVIAWAVHREKHSEEKMSKT